MVGGRRCIELLLDYVNWFLQHSRLVWGLYGMWGSLHAGQSTTDSSSSCPKISRHSYLRAKPTEQIRAHTLPLQLFCSHLIFFPFSATLVLLRIPAFSSRCPCRNADTQLSPQVTCFEMWLLCKHGSGESLMKGLLSACLISSISLIGAWNIFKYLKIFPGTKLKDLCDYSRTPKTFSADRGPPHGHKRGLERPLCIPN